MQRFRCTRCNATFSEEQPLDGLRVEHDKAVQIVKLLVEGVGVRAASRLTDCHTHTVLEVLKTVGQKCGWLGGFIVNYGFFRFFGDENDGWPLLLASFLAGALAVGGASNAAPSHKLQTGIAVCAVIIFASGLLSFPLVASSQWMLVFQLVCTDLGALFYLKILHDKPKPNPPA